LDEQLATDHGTCRWRALRSTAMDGTIDLSGLAPRDDVEVYATCEFDWPVAEDLWLKCGSDDGLAIWLNGERLQANWARRGLTLDEDQHRVRFRQGKNRLLLKVSQGGGGWGFSVRLCALDGAPLDLSAK
jgi:hypothetical protein